MDIIKKIWPTPFNVKEKSVGSLLIQIIIFIIIVAIAGVVIGFLSGLPNVGFIFSIIGSLLGLCSRNSQILGYCQIIDNKKRSIGVYC